MSSKTFSTLAITSSFTGRGDGAISRTFVGRDPKSDDYEIHGYIWWKNSLIQVPEERAASIRLE